MDGVRVQFGAGGDLFFVGRVAESSAIPDTDGRKRDAELLPTTFLYDVSADGKWLAVWRGKSVVVSSTDSGTQVKVCERCATAGEENRGITPPLVRWPTDGTKRFSPQYARPRDLRRPAGAR